MMKWRKGYEDFKDWACHHAVGWCLRPKNHRA